MAWNPYLLKDNKFRGQSIETYVQGAERVKYFKRPVIPMIKTVPPEVVMQINEERIESAKMPVEEPKTKTQEVQTIFRDGEAQTIPYTPEYIIDKENVPEVLSIANLQFNKGLPASMAEMELIEQMREKRAFENALPPTSDEACFVLRRKLMEELEDRLAALQPAVDLAASPRAANESAPLPPSNGAPTPRAGGCSLGGSTRCAQPSTTGTARADQSQTPSTATPDLCSHSPSCSAIRTSIRAASSPAGAPLRMGRRKSARVQREQERSRRCAHPCSNEARACSS